MKIKIRFRQELHYKIQVTNSYRNKVKEEGITKIVPMSWITTNCSNSPGHISVNLRYADEGSEGHLMINDIVYTVTKC